MAGQDDGGAGGVAAAAPVVAHPAPDDAGEDEGAAPAGGGGDGLGFPAWLSASQRTFCTQVTAAPLRLDLERQDNGDVNLVRGTNAFSSYAALHRLEFAAKPTATGGVTNTINVICCNNGCNKKSEVSYKDGVKTSNALTHIRSCLGIVDAEEMADRNRRNDKKVQKRPEPMGAPVAAAAPLFSKEQFRDLCTRATVLGALPLTTLSTNLGMQYLFRFISCW